MTITNTHTQTGSAALTPDLVTLSGPAVAGLVELLDHCHAFLETHPTVRTELDAYCDGRSPALTGSWMIDRLAWHAVLLRLQLGEQAVEDRRHG